ncbi:hypothetical protein Lupro_01910 [Lutibacter profundi]|uniref:Gliding motility lipoprotein GldD n=1 Tax=Lutibacter profundi TaxID=1622118 RepID=A0A0X8G4V5_9FLAO|nr:hypothetical protein [Lutibacter profundi]AMC10080.1 hypothetical protein Lupro_01910 [Lutibacter profundi]
MKRKIILIVFCAQLISCNNPSELSKKYNCPVNKSEKTLSVYDFKKNFKLDIITNWKTKLYYNNFESEIFTADTTKQLTKSLILVASFSTGILNIDSLFYRRVDSILKKNNLQIIDSGNQPYQSKPTYWYVAKGVKNGFSYHQFNLTTKRSENTYFNVYSEIYGDTDINERICETISLIEKVEFLQ